MFLICPKKIRSVIPLTKLFLFKNSNITGGPIRGPYKIAFGKRNIHQGGVFGNVENSEPGDEEREALSKRRIFFKIIFILLVPLAIMLALAAGIKEFYWIALVFMLICSLFIFLIFVNTFFSRGALKMRKTNYKKHDLN